MSLIRIYVFNVDTRAEVRTAIWTGDVDWPGAPAPGSTWFHCGEWAGETVNRVGFNAPVPEGEPALTVEVRTDSEIIRHLIDEHGFTS